MTRPMIFSEDEAFEQLRDEDVVYTVRKEKKELQDVWVRRSRTGPKEFDAEIFVNFTVNDWGQLDSLVEKSGFDTVEDWKEAIKRTNNGELPDKAYMHGVQKPGHDEIRFMEEG